MNHIPFIVGYMWVAYGLYLVYMWAILENDSLVKGIYQVVDWVLISAVSRTTGIVGLARA